MASLALQLLTYQKTETLPLLLVSLKAQTDKDWVLYLSDDGSSKEVRDEQKRIIEAAEVDFPIVFFLDEQNLGFAGRHQLLFQKHQADYVALINDDTILEADYVAKLRKYLDENPKTAAISGVILRWYFETNGEVKKTTIVDSLGLIRNRAHRVSDFGAGRPLSKLEVPEKIFGVSGCLPMYRREAVGEQLFDPTYFLYKEDVDLAYRLNKAGWSAAVVSAAVAYHQRTFQPSLTKRRAVSYRVQYLSYRNHWRNLWKHLTWRDWLKDGWAIIPFEAAKLIFILFTHPSIIWRTWREWL
jgi:GT2 family glycosyltransferase